MNKLVAVIFTYCLLANFANIAIASSGAPDQFQQLQAQLKQMQADQQAQLDKLNNQIQNQLKQMQSQFQDQIQKVNSMAQNQIKQVQTTLQQQIKLVHEEVMQNKS